MQLPPTNAEVEHETRLYLRVNLEREDGDQAEWGSLQCRLREQQPAGKMGQMAGVWTAMDGGRTAALCNLSASTILVKIPLTQHCNTAISCESSFL